MSISELKHVSEPARRIEVFTGHGRRRSWAVADKLEGSKNPDFGPV